MGTVICCHQCSDLIEDCTCDLPDPVRVLTDDPEGDEYPAVSQEAVPR